MDGRIQPKIKIGFVIARYEAIQSTQKYSIMQNTKIFKMPFASVYPLYIAKVERKWRTKSEVDTVIMWLTGYDEAGLTRVLDEKIDFETFFREAPHMHPNRTLITGSICGYKIQEIEDPLMRNIRYLDKLVDEIAKGKEMEKILRILWK